ncbi:hypothetical protein FBDF15_11190 [Faecalibacterium duncaniae]|jgi:hypothetical protein
MLVKKSAKRLANSAKVLYNKIMRGSTGVARKRAAQPVNANGRTPPANGINLSKGEYDYDLFAASTEYVPDHQRS